MSNLCELRDAQYWLWRLIFAVLRDISVRFHDCMIESRWINGLLIHIEVSHCLRHVCKYILAYEYQNAGKIFITVVIIITGRNCQRWDRNSCGVLWGGKWELQWVRLTRSSWSSYFWSSGWSYRHYSWHHSSCWKGEVERRTYTWKHGGFSWEKKGQETDNDTEFSWTKDRLS